MEPTDLTGAVLDGRYRVIEPIAEGAMGVVYRAERLKLGRIVAIKVLHDELPAELSSRKRFEIEAMAMAKLEHPHCAAVVDVGVHGDKPFVVMDFVSGRSLKDVIDEGPLARERAVEIMRQVLSGVAHAHDLGIIHRDIKPANIVLSQKAGLGDHVKILDFGLARLTAADNGASGITTGIVVGTPSYMAPEQIRGIAIDHRADLYACGILMFELLTGKKPFVSAKDDPIEVCSMHLKNKPPLLKDIQPGLDLEVLEPIVARALAKKPEERYATAVDFAVALDVVPTRRMATAPVAVVAPPPNVASESGWAVPADAKSSMFAGGDSAPVSGRGVPIAGAMPSAPESAGVPQGASGAPQSPPVGAPVGAPQSPPVGAPVSAPPSAPVSAPVSGPHGGPVSGPHAGPVSGPHAGPVSAPMSAPQSGPGSAPYSGPVSAPHAGPMSAPQSTPAGAPYSGPVSAPYAMPVSAPQSTPVSSHAGPISTPVSAPPPASQPAGGAVAPFPPPPSEPQPAAGLPADFDLSRVIPQLSPTGANEKGLSPGFDLSLAIPKALPDAPLERSAPVPAPPVVPPSDQPTMAMPDGKQTVAFLGAPPAGPSPLAAADVPAIAEPVRLPPPPAAPQLPLTLKQLKIIGASVLGLILLVAIIAAASGGSDKESVAPVADAAVVTPNPPPPKPQASPADEQVTRANEMLAANRQNEALELLLAARRVFPKDARFPYLAGKIYFERQWWSVGLKQFRDVLVLDPTYRSDPVMIKIVLKAFITPAEYPADLGAFLRNDIGPPAREYLEETAQTHPRAGTRLRAKNEAAKIR